MWDHLRWQRSSHSTGANNCVETARHDDGRIAVRDSKNATGARGGAGGTLLFTPVAWNSFVGAVRATADMHDGGRGCPA